MAKKVAEQGGEKITKTEAVRQALRRRQDKADRRRELDQIRAWYRHYAAAVLNI